MAAAISPSLLILLGFMVFIGSLSEGSKEEVGIYEIKNGNFSVKITNYGATVISVILPDKNGKLEDVVLGFDSVDDYKNNKAYFGAILGRVANRIGGAKFKLNGTVYRLPANDHGNTLHGGPSGFSYVVWKVEDYKKDHHLTLSYNSSDGEQGFPGELSVKVTYMLIGKNKLILRMKAKAVNKATPVNLASHTYWNLGGHDSGDILSHKIQLFGSKITPLDEQFIPTGVIEPVKGTPYDFLTARVIRSRWDELPGGYDINYVLDSYRFTHLQKAAVIEDRKSSRKLDMWTNQPGDILSRKYRLFSSKTTPLDDQLIPTSAIEPVKGTFGFLKTRVIKSQWDELTGGYGINYMLDSHRFRHLRKAAVVEDGKSGRKLELWTNQPGVQFYTSNMLNDTKGKGGFVYRKHAALCLETQGFPDAVNHPNFPSQILNPEETYDHVMVYRFTAH
ncbi:unnamed protein product [Cuscuta europaea]|uniref:Aldose 1-epimerase n=1 Tax=Cuscuta europaea TaxID=41803 RepID=A0A9P0YXA1_CUSEU|nr:unnamed protein product [Cuscuta europaea]